MRLLIRPDLDGLTCAVLLSRVLTIDEVVFVEPHPLQTGQVEVRSTDIVANLPYHPNCGMWFDHHASNALPEGTPFQGAFHVDPSAARTIFNYYEGRNMEPYLELLEATDRVDSAQLSLEDVLHPEGYVLLSLTLDPRTNLDPGSDRYYHQLLEWLKTDSIEMLLAREEVRSRVERILGEQQAFETALRSRSHRVGPVVVTDFRGLDPQPVGSRFLVYALFPECSLSLKAYPAKRNPLDVGLSIGHSIFFNAGGKSVIGSQNSSGTSLKNNGNHEKNGRETGASHSPALVSAGALCAVYGGGGHVGAGSCVVSADKADAIMEEMLQVMQGLKPMPIR